MSINLSNGITKVLRILKPVERPQPGPSANLREAELKFDEQQVSARNYYQAVIDNSAIKTKTYEPTGNQSASGSYGAVQAQPSDHDHWFDARSQNKNKKPSDSSYRLQAFLQPGKVKELKTLDKNYLNRKAY
jgi:hypothetical protein